MTLRALALCLGAWGLCASVSAPAQEPPQAAAPAQVQPAEDPVRLEMETRLKQLQRREQFDEMDLATREVLVKDIIDLMIELGRDFTPYQQKLKDVQDALGKQESAVELQRRREQYNQNLKAQATRAMAATPPQWREAVRLLNMASRLNPKDPETLVLKATAARGLRQFLVYRIALGSLLSLATIAALLTGIKALRRGPRVRRLEMVEGPQPGEVFRLEKETTTLGASSAEADWVIADPSRRISRHHCEIARGGKRYFLTDCSSNGTAINGKPAPKGEPVLLHRGDRIALAEDVVLRFR